MFSFVFQIFNTSVLEHFKIILNDLKTFPNRSNIEFNDKYLSNSIFFKNGTDWKVARSAQTHYFTSKNFRNLLGHFEKVTANSLVNIENLRKETKSDDLEVKKLAKYFSLDCISKVLFAIDIDSYKERNSAYVKSAVQIGATNFIQASLMTILPSFLSSFFQLQLFKIKPIITLGDYFKKLIKERKKTGIKYNDLTEALQNEKANLNENEVIGNILLAFFAGLETRNLNED